MSRIFLNLLKLTWIRLSRNAWRTDGQSLLLSRIFQIKMFRPIFILVSNKCPVPGAAAFHHASSSKAPSQEAAPSARGTPLSAYAASTSSRPPSAATAANVAAAAAAAHFYPKDTMLSSALSAAARMSSQTCSSQVCNISTKYEKSHRYTMS